ncbi:MAG: hypothetical protein KY476_11470 [Planctomycetes bacterium]|nr:hypothetical protein [Planctomycetota bacterium]
MRRISMITFALVAVLTSHASKAVDAANVYFMPGDAFFHTILTDDSLKVLERAGDTITLTYDLPAASFCGFAGFERIQIDVGSSRIAQRLRNVYDSLRRTHPKVIAVFDQDGKTVQHEINGFHLLIYNKSVDFSKQRLAIRYNESWFDLPDEVVGPQRLGTAPATVYQPLFRDHEAVVHDWQWSREYDALKVSVPAGLTWGRTGEAIAQPVRGKASEFQFVILADESLKTGSYSELKSYFRQKPGWSFLSVSDSGVRQFQWKKGKLHSTEREE